MKRRIIIAGLLATVLLITFAFSQKQSLKKHTQKSGEKEVYLTEAITQFLSLRHYEPVQIDDDFSKKVFDLYIERLDYNKRYLFADDIKELNKYENKLDDEYQARSFDFFNLSSEIIQKRLLETKEYYTKYLSTPFDLKINESIDSNPDNAKFPDSKEKMEEAWRKSLKFQVLARVAGNLAIQEKAAEKSDTVKIKDVQILEAEAREALLDTYNDWYDRVKKLDREDRQAVYLNAMISAYDPHSTFMPPRDKERFDVYMAGKYEGIGATLQQKQGYLKVVDMFPGSPSWRSKVVEIGDLIISVAQGDDEPVDILDMKMETAVALIKGPKATKVRLSLKKRDGSIVEISLIRDVIIMEETYASSLLLNNPDNKSKIGYINLPKFYLDFGDRNGRRCSKDVLSEINKLKAEGAEGIILDLRNNGGGSLPEVVDMAGLFIEKGPIVQVKTRNGKPVVLDDKDGKVHYDGPLVVMTNYSSASASEIFAAAIQDYHRGVIVGSPSTFGKGTVQRVVNIDDYLPAKLNSIKPFGALSLTVQKYYRINGKTTQLKGVTPDIILPDSYQYLDIGEKEQAYALPWDETTMAKYSEWEDPLNLNSLNKNSKKRIAKSNNFALITKNALRLKKDSDRSVFSLNLENYQSFLEKRQQEAKEFNKLFKEPTGIKLEALQKDLAIFKSDTAKSERTSRMIEDLGKDFYLSEAMNVITEMIGNQ
ncbi:MAG: carboxy terminal-processing peptidase [Bacteroidales bacterium]|nr:carboxy terminal-processing peptidase [Bacteroidales bacterium]